MTKPEQDHKKAREDSPGEAGQASHRFSALFQRAQNWIEKVTSHPQDTADKAALPVAAETEIRAATHVFMLLSALLLIVFGTWASCSRLDIMSVANGEVVPSGNIKKVQHLEGGIVRAILVKEGEVVKKGQALIEMASTATESSLNEVNIREASLRITIARLSAELVGDDRIVIDDELLSVRPDLIQQARGVFQANQEQMKNILSGQDKLLAQKQQTYNELEARVRNEKARRDLLKEQIEINESLLKEDLTSRYQHLELLKQANLIDGSIEENSIAMKRAKSALEEQESKRAAVISSYKKELQGELELARRSHEELIERLRKFEDNLKRAVLRAPVDGIVKTLYVVTEGGVVRPGATLLDIVPQGAQLIIEAKLPTRDVGYVKLGQTALLRLASADAFKYGVLEGEVVAISPDTIVSPQGMPYYKVTIATGKAYFGKRDMRYMLSPGMLLQVSIQTGERTVMQYILGPIVGGSSKAMTER